MDIDNRCLHPGAPPRNHLFLRAPFKRQGKSCCSAQILRLEIGFTNDPCGCEIYWSDRLTTTMDSVGTNSYTYTSGGFVALCRCLPYPSAVAISSPKYE